MQVETQPLEIAPSYEQAEKYATAWPWTASDRPLMSCIMPTYGRPNLVPEAVLCFLQQDYPNKELIVLNDCRGQEYVGDIPNVRIINIPDRFPSLGEKRNAAIELAKGEILLVWDDDDIFLPWRLSLTWSEMCRYQAPFYRPSQFLAYWGEARLHDNYAAPSWVNHSTTAFTRGLWEAVGGYPAMDVGEDAAFFDRIHAVLDRDFITYPISHRNRFYIMRGISEYQHMSISGGKRPLDTSPGQYPLQSSKIADPTLRKAVDRILIQQGIHHPELPLNSRIGSPPRISVCVALKNRTRLISEGHVLDLFPRCVRALSDAATDFGPIELIVADFSSDDEPLEDWLYSQGNLRVTRVQVEGAFSRGRGLNAAVRAATSDVLFLMDADILVDAPALQRGLDAVSAGEARFPICCYLDLGGNHAFWQELGYGLTFLSREVFDRCQGLHEFDSWGGEDDLFLEQVEQFCSINRDRDPDLRHQWHPDESRHTYYQNPAGSDYMQQGPAIRSRLVPRVRATFAGNHPFWSGPDRRVILTESGRLIRPNMDFGTYEWTEHLQLTLKWDRWPAEQLIWDSTAQLYRDPTKPFTLRRIEEPSAIIQSLRADCGLLADRLRSLGPFQYIDCGGNRGDLVIRAGTLAFFSSQHLEYHEITDLRLLDPQLPAVMSGSGGFCRFWGVAPRVANELAKRCSQLVILPSTFEQAALDALDGRRNVYLYAREQTSVNEVGDRFPVEFCPDLAFWLDLFKMSEPSQPVGHVFRLDAEGFGFGANLADNYDLSLTGQRSPEAFVDDICRFETLHTDRLHAAVVALMAGRKVHLYPNRYHKNRSYYDSVLHRFSCVWEDGMKPVGSNWRGEFVGKAEILT